MALRMSGCVLSAVHALRPIAATFGRMMNVASSAAEITPIGSELGSVNLAAPDRVTFLSAS